MAELSPHLQVLIAVAHVFHEHGGDPPMCAVAAAAIRAAVDRVVPEQCESPAGEGEPWPRDYQLMSDSKWEQRQQIRTEFLAIASELDGGNNTTTQEPDR